MSKALGIQGDEGEKAWSSWTGTCGGVGIGSRLSDNIKTHAAVSEMNISYARPRIRLYDIMVRDG